MSILAGFTAMKPIAWLLGNLKIAAIVASAFVLTSGLSYCKGRSDGKAIEQAKLVTAMKVARELSDRAAGTAAQERETDRNEINQAEKDRNDAINSAPDGDAKPSAASNNLNCERLRRAQADISQFPACRGRAGEGEAAPNR